MKRTMLIGESHSGKSSLIRALTGEAYEPRKALALQYFHNFVDTPGEFLENRRFFRFLLTASQEVDILLFAQDATRIICMLRPGFATMFNREVVGVITKCDHVQADIVRARRLLTYTGLHHLIETDVKTGRGLDELRAELARCQDNGKGAVR